MIEWAPLSTPLKRRVETLSVLLWIFLLPMFTSSYFLLLFFVPRMLPYLLCYLVWVWLDPSPECGGRMYGRVRRLSYWRWVRGYFPLEIKKTEELCPKKKYIFGYHPHGIIALGAFINFGTEASCFSKLYPGLKLHVLTLGANFKLPFWRELLLWLGLCSVNKRSCESILTKGESLMIVVGGASEAIHAYPGTYNLILSRRLGFIKLALHHGATLIPVLSFNETSLWSQLPNPPKSLTYKFQKLIQRLLTFTPIFFFGRGVFQYSYGIVPFRKRVVSVVGEGIECPKVERAGVEVVEKYHEIYCGRLKEVFERYKEEYSADRKSELMIIE